MRVPGCRPNTPACSQHCSDGERCAWRMPLGALVVPDEKITSAGSSGVMAAARASSRSSGTASPAASSSSHDGSPSTATRRRCGRSSAMAARSSPNRRASSRDWVSTTVARQVSTSWASSGRGENVDMGAATAPASAAPKMAATASGRLPMSTPTAVAGLDAGGEQRPPDAARLGPEALVGPPHGLAVAQRVVEHDGLVRTEAGRDLARGTRRA